MSFPKTVLPRMVEVRQKISSPRLDDPVAETRKELERLGLPDKIKPGFRIAVTAGSRGIAHISEILRTIVEEVKKAGGDPFIVPSMGSHGGSTPEGQIAVLRALGITSETVGAPIHSSMEVEEVGRLRNGSPVYVDRKALEADGIIVVGRVKPHTDFKDKIESGLMKMMVIGLGKQKGAEMIHHYKREGYHELLPEAARLILAKAPIMLALAIVENGHHETAIVKAIQPIDIENEETALLEKAKALLARIPFREIDVLIVEEMGKEISGTGMDTNVTGRFWISGEKDSLVPTITSIVVLDLSDETHGNAIGIGLADLTTQRLVSKIDYQSTFVNSLTTCFPLTAKTPVFLPNDRDAITMAVQISGLSSPQEARVVRIKNTQELDKIWISENILETIRTNAELHDRLEITSEPREMQFDVLGNLAR
jgi:hypothetical protein